MDTNRKFIDVVITNNHFSPTSAITTVRDETGIIANFPYNPSDIASITQRYIDFAAFSRARNIIALDVIGNVVNQY